jgi:hypothetical protein
MPQSIDEYFRRPGFKFNRHTSNERETNLARLHPSSRHRTALEFLPDPSPDILTVIEWQQELRHFLPGISVATLMGLPEVIK